LGVLQWFLEMASSAQVEEKMGDAEIKE